MATGSNGSRTSKAAPWLTNGRMKLVLWVVCLTVVGTIVVQNWVVMDVPVLFATVRMPRAVLLLSMFLVGLVLGLTVRVRRRQTA